MIVERQSISKAHYVIAQTGFAPEKVGSLCDPVLQTAITTKLAIINRNVEMMQF